MGPPTSSLAQKRVHTLQPLEWQEQSQDAVHPQKGTATSVLRAIGREWAPRALGSLEKERKREERVMRMQ